MKDYWEEQEIKKINKKKVTISCIVGTLLVIFIIVGFFYIKNLNFREWVDKNILRKEVSQDKLATIELKEGENPTVYAFNQYIGVLNKNEFKIFNNMGKEEEKLNLQISTPIFDSSGRYLAVAETKGKKLYVICDKEICWEKEVDGNISQIHVNKNGYVAVTITDTINKTVITVYDNQGTQLFNNYLSTTRVSDIAISNDNKYLAIAEIDTSGTMIQSNINIISIDKAKNGQENAVIETFQGENNELITNIHYQDKNRIICMYTDKIKEITLEGKIDTITEYEDKKIAFSMIELGGHIATVEEKSSGLFTADSVVTITNIENGNSITYTSDSVTKEVYSYDHIIALNLGTEVEFINTSGWLVKRYKANQEITNITISSNIAGIIYRDKIEIVNL